MSTASPWTAASSATIFSSSAASRSASGANLAASSASAVCAASSLRPVQREIEVAAAVVELADSDATASGRARARCRSRGRAPRRADPGALVAGLLREHLERGGERQELAERVPAQVVLVQELLDVLGRGAAGARLEQAAAVHQRDDREHLGARPELEDREQVGQIVAQDVAGDRDRVLAAAGAVEREAGRVGDVDMISISRPSVSSRSSAGRTLRSSCASCGRCLVEPEDGRHAATRVRARRRARPSRGSARPSPGTCARCRRPATSCSISVAPLSSTTRTRAGRRDLERLVVRAVLLGLLGHQADVRGGAHRRGVERAVPAAVLDRLGVQRRVGVVGDHELRVLLLAGGVPHLTGCADRRRHRGVDDHVARDVQVGDPAVGVDHRERRASRRRRRSRPGSPRAALRHPLERRSSAAMPSSALTPAAASAAPCSRTAPGRTCGPRGRR